LRLEVKTHASVVHIQTGTLT